jgi:GT2 family glycosyltransferase
MCHQAVFFRKALFSKIGFYDTKYLIGGDPDWILRAFNSSAKFRYLNMPICVYAGGGVSDNFEMLFKTKQRLRKIYFTKSERFFYFWLNIIVSIYNRVRVLDFSVPYLLKILLRDQR